MYEPSRLKEFRLNKQGRLVAAGLPVLFLLLGTWCISPVGPLITWVTEPDSIWRYTALHVLPGDGGLTWVVGIVLGLVLFVGWAVVTSGVVLSLGLAARLWQTPADKYAAGATDTWWHSYVVSDLGPRSNY
jgi:predicted membrane channel-forming protein YqfA (hemolysin III family)